MAYGVAGTTITGSPPACRAKRSANKSIATATTTAIDFTAADRYDTDTMHDTVINPTRITFKTAGLYNVGGNAEWAFNATSFRLLGIRLNGTTIIAQVIGPPESTGVGTQQLVDCTYKFAVNDYVELICQQNTGGNLNITFIANYSPEFWATWQGLGT